MEISPTLANEIMVLYKKLYHKPIKGMAEIRKIVELRAENDDVELDPKRVMEG
jgi:hypothetical protein